MTSRSRSPILTSLPGNDTIKTIMKHDALYQQILEHQPYDEKEELDKSVMLDFLKRNDDALTRDNRVAHFTASAWIVNPSRTKVLMVYHKIYNSWSWVGGHADGDADLFHVVNKEVEEETGLKNIHPLVDGIYALNVITVNSHIKRGKLVNCHLHFDAAYLFEADESDAVRIKEDENSGIKWISIEDIDRCVTEEVMKPIYARLNKKLATLC